MYVIINISVYICINMGQIRASGQKELMCNDTGSVTLVFCLRALMVQENESH